MLKKENGIVVLESVFCYFIHAVFYSFDDIATIAKKVSFIPVVNIDSIFIQKNTALVI